MNVDLAAEADRVVVLHAGEPRPDDESAAALEDARRVLVRRPSQAFGGARGDDPLDPAVRPGCVRAGLEQGGSSTRYGSVARLAAMRSFRFFV